MIVILIPTIPGLTDRGGSGNDRGESWQSEAGNTSFKPDYEYTANGNDGGKANQNKMLIYSIEAIPNIRGSVDLTTIGW